MLVEAEREVAPTALILTALPEERAAVLKLLGTCTKEAKAAYRFRVGSADGWRVVVGQSGKTNEAAADLTRVCMEHFKPCVALFVGTAGRRKDVSLGDVVVGERLSNYEIGKETEKGFLPRSYEQPASHRLVQIAKELEVDCLLSVLPDGLPEGTKIVVGHITSGSKTLTTDTGPVASTHAAHFDDAIAVEQEGHGFLSVALKCEAPAVVVRGISDGCVGKSETDTYGWQEKAAHHAAIVALAILREFPKPEPPPALPALPRIAELAQGDGETCGWSGALDAQGIASLWDSTPPPVDVFRLRLRDDETSLALQGALLRLLCHIPDGSPLVVEAEGSGWQLRYARLMENRHGTAFQTRGHTWLEAQSTSTASPGGAIPADDMAAALHTAMDAWTLRALDREIQGVLTKAPGTASRIQVEIALAEDLRRLWNTWRSGMDDTTRARFLSLLATLQDEVKPAFPEVAIGARMVPAMACGAILALALAQCGGLAQAAAHSTGLRPCATGPGNLAADLVRCHSSGVKHWGQRDVAHPDLGDLTQVKARLLLLANHKGDFRIDEGRQRPIGAAPVSTALNSKALSRPAILTYHRDFADALRNGTEHVRQYLKDRLAEENLRGQAILDALDKSA